jgi:hypothetical protein
MPSPDLDATTPKYLRDKYAIVGIGETAYSRGSGVSTRALATTAVRNAIADAGLKPNDVDGMLSYLGPLVTRHSAPSSLAPSASG